MQDLNYRNTYFILYITTLLHYCIIYIVGFVNVLKIDRIFLSNIIGYIIIFTIEIVILFRLLENHLYGEDYLVRIMTLFCSINSRIKKIKFKNSAGHASYFNLTAHLHLQCNAMVLLL